MCKFYYEVTLCGCREADRCLGLLQTDQVNIGGTPYHILSDPVHRSEACSRRRIRERLLSPSRECFLTTISSRRGPSGDKILYTFSSRPCSHCSMCSNYI